MKSFIKEVTERPLRVGGPSFRPAPDGWRERPEGPREKEPARVIEGWRERLDGAGIRAAAPLGKFGEVEDAIPLSTRYWLTPRVIRGGSRMPLPEATRRSEGGAVGSFATTPAAGDSAKTLRKSLDSGEKMSALMRSLKKED